MTTQSGTSALSELLDGEVDPAVSEDDGSSGPPPVDPEEEKKKKRRKFIFWLLVTLLALLIALIAWYLVNRKPITSAIPGVTQDRAPAYLTSYYGLTKPLGVAVTSDGSRIYVTEGGTALDLKVLDGKGKLIRTVAMPGNGLHQPQFVAVNPDNGEVWTTDSGSKQVVITDRDGKVLRTFKPSGDLGKPEFIPLGIAFGPDKTVYISDMRGTDSKAHRVLVFRTDGTLVRSMGKPSELNFPNGIVVDQGGNAFVTDSNNGRMVIFDTKGVIGGTISRGFAAGDLGLPRGIAFDDQKRLFVVDTMDHQVRIYKVGDKPSVAPTYVLSFGEEGRADGTFEYPNGLATDNRARIYVTDRENNRLQVWGY